MRLLLTVTAILLIFIAISLVCFPAIVRAEAVLDAGLEVTNKTASGSQKRLKSSMTCVKGQSFLSLGYDYTKYGQDTVENETSGSVGYDSWLADKWETWSFASGAKDRAISKQNYDAGGGAKYVFANNEQYFSLSGGIIFAHMDYLDIKKSALRVSIRPKLKLKYGGFEFRSIWFYQPRTTNLKDYIVRGFCELKYNITQSVGIKLKFEDEYISMFNYNKAKTMLMVSIKWGNK